MLASLSRIITRIKNLRYIVPVLLLVTTVSWGMAQTDGDRVLVPGQPVEGVISAENISQTYVFSSVVDDSATLILTPGDNFALTMIITDTNGEKLAQEVGDGSGETRLEDIPVAAGQVYFVTVFPSAGADSATAGTFALSLGLVSTVVETEAATPETTEAPVIETAPETTETPTEIPADSQSDVPFRPGSQVLLNNGIQVNLRWETTDDLNLQVRDPNGGTLFWDSRSTNDGGTFGPDVNGLCEVLTEPPATETANWPGGPLPAGSYEILVYYRQACEGNNPVNFTVDVTVDGTPLELIEGSLLPPVNNNANVYLSSFTVNPDDGGATVGESGPYTDTRDLVGITTGELLALEATPVAIDTPVEGLITNGQPFQTYTFEGLGDQIINVTMNALNGNLDPLLLVLDSAGNIIAGNDDAEAVVNINSRIQDLRLPVDDVYTIVASRYGKIVGGTEGSYELAVSGSEIPAELTTLNLPAGDIEVTLTWDAAVDLQLLVRDPSGNAVYDDQPTIPSGGRLGAQGNINCNIVETGSPVSYVYWPEGFGRIGAYEIEVWYQSECNSFGPATFNIYVVYNNELVFTENVLIEFNQRYLTSFFINQDGLASPSASGIIGGSETLNYQDELASAVNVASGQSVPGSITADDKFDVYIFEGQAGDLVTISMNATSDTLDTLLFLIDPNGIEIASNDDANAETTNSLIADLLLSQDGQYIILATHYGAAFGGTTGGYNLSLRIEG